MSSFHQGTRAVSGDPIFRTKFPAKEVSHLFGQEPAQAPLTWRATCE